MESIRTYKQLVDDLKSSNERKCVVLVCPSDEHSQYVVERCLNEGLADFVLVVETKFMERAEAMRKISPDHVEIFEVGSPEEASAKGVSLIHEGKGDVLMKGLKRSWTPWNFSIEPAPCIHDCSSPWLRQKKADAG